MSRLSTAAVLATTTVERSIPLIATEIGSRMEHLLETPPEWAEETSDQEFHAPVAEWSSAGCFISTHRVLRVEVCVDLDRLGDPAYKDAIVRDARAITRDFLKKERE